jgi:hypothetical protein
MEKYVESLLDPFVQFDNPKIYDGRAPRSSGFKLRTTGEVALKTNGPSFFVLFPGLCNNLYINNGVSTYEGPPAYNNHIRTPADRASIKKARVVSAGLRFSLMNSAIENEGFFEAVRVPFVRSDFELHTGLTDDAFIAHIETLAGTTPVMDISNHQTYFMGKLRDIHRYQFKLNYENPDQEFNEISSVTDIKQMISPGLDVIIIKIHGRNVSTSPSSLMFDCVTNQEVVYVENTALGRLMTQNPKLPNMDELLTKTNYGAAAIQVA